MIKYLIAINAIIAYAQAENVGWRNYFTENPTEFHDLPLKWENGNQTNVPSWLSGVYVRNGPAQLTFGSEKRHLSSWLDGFAKLHSFKFDGKKVYFSGKMIESTTYMDSLKAGELVPQITMNKLKNPDEEWTLMDMEKIGERAINEMLGDMTHNAYDNNNPGLWRFGSKENPMYIATTDYPYPQRFDIDTLETLELLRPADPMMTMSGCTHWLREPGTDNSIYFQWKMNMLGKDYVQVQRFTPDNRDYDKPEVIATFSPKRNAMVHSFSITKNYAVFFYYPLELKTELSCLFGKKFHVMECLEYHENEPTEIFVVHLKTGEVKHIEAQTWVSYHHINAYETEEGNKILLDLAPADPLSIRTYVDMDNMLNPPEFSFANGSTCGEANVTRYHIDLNTGSVTTSTFTNIMKDSAFSRYMDKYDFPVINEAYRGLEYCIIYGWSAFDYSRSALIKKNTCDPSQDRVIYTENHYTSEMFFIASPQPKSEDDGVLVSITFDGEKEQSYLVLIDALTFSVIDRAWLPHNIPWSAHGMHFPEAKWTIQEKP